MATFFFLNRRSASAPVPTTPSISSVEGSGTATTLIVNSVPAKVLGNIAPAEFVTDVGAELPAEVVLPIMSKVNTEPAVALAETV